MRRNPRLTKHNLAATILSAILVFFSTSPALALIKGYKMSGCGPQIQFEKQMLEKVAATPKFCGEGLIPISIGAASCRPSRNPSCPAQGITCMTQFQCVEGSSPALQSEQAETQAQVQEAPPAQQRQISEAVSVPVTPPPSVAIQQKTAIPTPVPTQEVTETSPQSQVAQEPIAVADPSPVQHKQPKSSTLPRNMGFLMVALLIFSWISLYKIFEKAGELGIKAFIPIYSWYVMYRIAGLSFMWFALACIPYLGAIAHFRMNHELSKRFGHGTPMTVFLVILPFFALPYLAFNDSEIYSPP